MAEEERSKARKIGQDKIFNLVLYFICGIIILLVLYPMYFIVIASFSDPTAVANGEIFFLPKGLNLKAYKKQAEYDQLWVGYKNTILYVIGGTAMTVMVNIPASYA